MLSFWITFLCLNYIKCSRESQYGTIVKKLKSEPYCGKGGNNGCFNEGICNDGKCSCTTKGITGKQCNLCDEGYTGDAVNSTCYYGIRSGFQYSFRLKENVDKDVTKLNCKVIMGDNVRRRSPMDQPIIKIKVEAENPTNITVNSTVNVKVKTGLPDYLTEEHVAQSNKTQQFVAMVDPNEFKVGPETNRTIFINIYNFTTPLTIKVTVTQESRRSLWIGIIFDYFWNTFLRFPFLRELYKAEPRTVQLLSSQSID